MKSGMKVYFTNLSLLVVSKNLLNLIKHYLTDRFQRVLLNGQCSNWQPVLAGVPQGSILGPFLFLIYINDLLDGLKSNVKLFADDTSLFSVVKNKEESASDLTNDLDTISKWAYSWKISFNPDAKGLFSRENSNITHPTMYFNNVQVHRANQQKHLGINLDDKLNFKCHIDKVLTKITPPFVKKFYLFNTKQLLQLLVQFKVPPRKTLSRIGT